MRDISMKKICISMAISVILSIILLVVATTMVWIGDFSDRTVSVLVMGVSVISVLVGAFILARNVSCGGLVNGLILGILYCMALLILSLMINGCVSFEVGNITRIVAVLTAGMLGRVLGINTVKE